MIPVRFCGKLVADEMKGNDCMDFRKALGEALAKELPIPVDDIISAIETPPDPNMGDFAFPCFKAAKALKTAPPLIAQNVAEKMDKPDFISEIRCAGPYLNFFVDRKVYISRILEDVLAKKEDFGRSDEGGGKNIVIDYSSPNIAKPFHVGHLRSTVIGNALYKIYEFLGYNSVGINHLGDWGTQFGKLITAYKLWSSEEAVAEKGISELTRIYVKFHEEAENNPSLEDEARSFFVKMEQDDPEAIALWKKFYDISMVEFNRVYDMLGVKFDYFTGESFYNKKMAAVVQELEDKGLLEESDGAKIVNLDAEKMPPCLIIRSDGGTLYATRDITAALYRKKEYDFAKALYLTAMDQSLHFAQWFKVVEKMGYDWAKDLIHVPFGLVSLKEGKLSTRTGRVVLMEDLLNTATAKVLSVIEEKNPTLENKEQVAKDVGIGAVIFNDLYNNRIKDVVFDMDKMTSFEGETGPYVQYTHARCSSLISKADTLPDSFDFGLLNDEASLALCKLFEGFAGKIHDAADKDEPYLLTRHIMAIAQAFNKFYHDNPVLSCEDENLRNARLGVVFAVKTVLATGLGLLGIKAPDRM